MNPSSDLRGWLLRGSAITLFGRISFGVCTILQNAVAARLLDPGAMGAYLLTQSIILPAMLLAVFGTDFWAVRWIGSDKDVAEVICSCTTVVVVFSLVCGLTMVASLTVVSGLTASTWGLVAEWRWLFMPLIALSAAQALLAAFFRGLRRIGLATLMSGVLSSLLLLVLCGGAYQHGSYLSAYSIIVLQIITLMIAVIVGFVFIARHLRGARLGGRRPLKEIVYGGAHLMITQLLALVVTQSDIWIVSAFASPDSVAGYGLASRLAQLVSMPHLVLNGVLPPLMAGWYSTRQLSRLDRMMDGAVSAALFFALCAAALYGIAGHAILVTLFGGQYGSWLTVLLILVLGNIVNVAAGPCSQMLIMAGHERTLLVITACVCVFCCVGGAISAILVGPLGVAIVFAVGLSLQGILSAHWTRRLTTIRTYPTLRLLREGI